MTTLVTQQYYGSH